MWPKSIAELARGLGAADLTVENPSTPVLSLSTDSRKVSPGELFVAIKGETHDGHKFVGAALSQGAAAAVVERTWLNDNPQWKKSCVAVPDTTLALRALAKEFRKEFHFPVFAVGGSNGKTTTKEMLSCLLSGLGGNVTRTHKSENGFLGLAITLTQKAHNTTRPPAALVAEIGIDDAGAMIQHVEIALPDFALLTALGPEHLAGLGSWDNAVEEELILFRKTSSNCRRIWQCAEPRLRMILSELRPSDVVVCATTELNGLDKKALELIKSRSVALLTFEVIDAKATKSTMKIDWTPQASDKQQSAWSETFEIPLPGLHNAQNFALALAAAALVCPNVKKLLSAWTSFVPPEMRSRIVTLRKDIILYDDCYNASPASMEAAFDAMLSDEWKTRRKILVLGDMLDLGEESKSWHLKLIDKLLKFENSDLCLFGSAMYDVFSEIKTNHSETLRAAKIQLKHAGAEVNPASFLNDLSDRIPGSVVLVKGSRGMDLGRFVKSCEEWSSTLG